MEISREHATRYSSVNCSCLQFIFCSGRCIEGDVGLILMKSLHLERWGSQILPLSTRPKPRYPYLHRSFRYSRRWQTASAQLPPGEQIAEEGQLQRREGRQPGTIQPTLTPNPEIHFKPPDVPQIPLEDLPSPPISRITQSAKLAALHARLHLNNTIPIQTLARTLIHPTADPDPRFNNLSMSVLGNDLLGYYATEHIMCHYPRLPMAVLQAAIYAYVGPRALAAVAQSWGLEVAAEPGGEVNPGLLQFRRTIPGSIQAAERRANPDKPTTWRERALDALATAQPAAAEASDSSMTTLELASTSFIRALTAAVYLHNGSAASHAWFRTQLLTPRPLDVSKLFTFTQPTRDLSRLCAREGFEPPVARLESESGRVSRHPVFVVGVYSGRDKLGEAEGSSLDEARFRAAVRALKGWYLYSPAGPKMLPSESEGKGPEFRFQPAVIDDGEVIV